MYEKVMNQLRNAGLIVDSLEIDTASIVRCQVEGDNAKKRSGWYRIFSVVSKAGNTYYVGSYGNWKNGALPEKGVAIEYDGSGLSDEDWEAIKRKQREAQQVADRERRAKNKEAAMRAAKTWEGLGEDGHSKYLARKKVAGVGVRYTRGTVVVPVRKINGDLVGLQFINADGSKKFLTGTPKSGAFHTLGVITPDQPLVIAEGYATAASIHMATGYPVVVAFDAGNVVKVAAELRKAYSDLSLVIAADNDEAGLKYANQAAKRSQARVVVPVFKQVPEGQKLTDFNDLHLAESLEAVKVAIEATTQEDHTHSQPGSVSVPTDNQPPEEEEKPKSGYVLKQSGVYYVDANSQGEQNTFRVCGRIEVKARARIEADLGWRVHLQYENHDGEVCEWFAPSRYFGAEYGSRLVEELLDRGLDIDAHRNSKKRLMEYLQRSQPTKRIRLTTKMGWNGDAFLSPVKTIGQPKEELHYISDRLPLNRARTNGTLEGWKENVARYCVGNPVVMFAVAAGFAGPLLKLLGMNTVGFHFLGDSSLGKSTISIVAGSVCGGVDYFRTWNTTAAALEPTASEHSDSLLILDEINQSDGFTVGQTVYQLGNGEGKSRATDTGAGTRIQHKWKLVWLSNGERSLKEIQDRAGKVTEAGMEMRLLHIRADFNKSKKERSNKGIYQNLHDFAHGAALSDFLKLEVEKNHGHAFITFVEWLASGSGDDRKRLVSYVHRQIDEFQNKVLSSEAGGQARRASRAFGLIAVCGELATRQGITGWSEGDCAAAATLLFKNFLEDRGGEGNAEDKAMLEHICHELQSKGESHFTRWDNSEPTTDTHQPRSFDRWGYRRVEKEVAYGEGASCEELFYIYPMAFRKSLCKGFNYKRACELLAERGALERNANRGWMYQKRLPDSGPKPVGVYFIKMSALHDLLPKKDGNEGPELDKVDSL